MIDLITLANNLKKTSRKNKNFREVEHDKQKGKKKYQQRIVNDKEAEQEIKEYNPDSDYTERGSEQ